MFDLLKKKKAVCVGELDSCDFVWWETGAVKDIGWITTFRGSVSSPMDWETWTNVVRGSEFFIFLTIDGYKESPGLSSHLYSKNTLH
jgi:hypothetical protein